jgi:hypothetical protein
MTIVAEQNRIEAADRPVMEAEWMKVITILKTHRAVSQSTPRTWTTLSGKTYSEFTVTYSDIHKLKTTSTDKSTQQAPMTSACTSQYHQGLPIAASIEYQGKWYCYPCAAQIDV